MSQVRTYVETAAPADVWVDLLRANCLTLVERPQIAKAVSISRGFHRGAEDDRESFISLAQRMAEEYSLQVEVELEGPFVSVRFTRRESKTDTLLLPKGPSLFARLRGLMRRPHQDEKASSDEGNGPVITSPGVERA